MRLANSLMRRPFGAACAVIAAILSTLAVLMPVTQADEFGEGGVFVSLPYTRLLGATSFGPDQERSIPILGVGGVPASGVSAVLIDIAAATATSADGGAYVWPSGQTRPTIGQFRFGSDNVPRSNTVAVGVGSDGAIRVANSTGTSNFNVDIQGYFTAAEDSSLAPGGFVPVEPTRVIDTYAGVGAPQAKVGAGETIDVTLAGVAGVPTSASAVFANVEAANATEDGQLVIVPSGSSITSIPALNYSVGGRERSGLSIPLSSGHAKITNTGAAPVNVRVDVSGYFSADSATGGGFHVTSQLRIFDTTVGAPLAAGEEVTANIGGIAGIPGNDAAVMLSVIAMNYSSSGGIVVRAADAPSSILPSVVFDAPETGTNASTVVVQIGSLGMVRLRNTSSGPVDVRMHLQGWFAMPSTETSAAPAAGPLASGQILKADGVGAANAPVSLAALVSESGGLAEGFQVLGSTTTDASGFWQIPRPSTATPIDELEITAAVGATPVLFDYAVPPNATTSTAETTTVTLRVGLGEVPQSGGTVLMRSTPEGAKSNDVGTNVTIAATESPTLSEDAIGPHDALISDAAENTAAEEARTEEVYAEAVGRSPYCAVPRWKARDFFKYVWVPLKTSRTLHNSKLIYDFETSTATDLAVAFTVGNQMYQGGFSGSVNENTSMRLSPTWNHNEAKLVKLKWKYRLFRKRCDIPAFESHDPAYWYNEWKWMAYEPTPFTDWVPNTPSFACNPDATGPIHSRFYLEETVSVTWRGWFKMTLTHPKTGAYMSAELDDKQTQTSRTGLEVIPDPYSTPYFCGSGPSFQKSAFVRQISHS